MNKNIKKIVIELVQRDGFSLPKIDLIEGTKLDDVIQGSITDLVEKGCGFFAENVDEITIITKDNKRIKVKTDNYYFG